MSSQESLIMSCQISPIKGENHLLFTAFGVL